jgi:hypothetical protein
MLAVHGAIGTFRRAVDLYLAPGDAALDEYAKARLPAGRIFVRPSGGMALAAAVSAGESYDQLIRGYELAIRRRSTVAGHRSSPPRDSTDLAMLRRRAVAARWQRRNLAIGGVRSAIVPSHVWVPSASNLAIVRSDAPAAFQAKVA